MSTPSFTVAQQVAAFTVSVDAASELTFASPADMQAFVTKLSAVNLADPTIQGFIGGDWTPVWGPIVWANPAQQGPSYIADNTLACYYSPSQKLFVVAIAGTNPGSLFDWGQEDFDVSTTVAWNQISTGSGASSGNISAGTAKGMTNLLALTSGGTSMVDALKAYIQANNITGATIAVGGHSLGGALAPCMGLYLYDNAGAHGLTGQNIAVYAFAGPTPGDKTFAGYYEGRINGTSFTYSSVYNTIDIVPQAWVLDSMTAIPTIYGSNIPFSDTPGNTFVGVLTTCMQLSSLKAWAPFGKPYTQVATNRDSFTAAFNADVYTNCSTKVASFLSDSEVFGVSSAYMTELGAVVDFMYQAAAQHTPAYFGGTLSLPKPSVLKPKDVWTSQPVTGQLGIDAFTLEYQKNRTAAIPATATFVSSAAVMVKKVTGIDLHDTSALSQALAAQQTAKAHEPAAVA